MKLLENMHASVFGATRLKKALILIAFSQPKQLYDSGRS